MATFDKLQRLFPKYNKVGFNKFITALVETLGELDDQIKLDIAESKDQLFVTLADGIYLEALGSNKGVEKPDASILNLSDDDFRKLIPVLSTFPKQVKSTIVDLLDVFYGPSFSRSNTTGATPQPFNLGSFFNLTGQVNIVANSLKATGIGTQFLTELQAGDYIKAQSAGNELFVKVARIVSNNELTLASRYTGTIFTGLTVGYTPKTLLVTHENGDETIDISPIFLSDPTQAEADEIINAINNIAKNFTASTVRDAFAQEILVNVRTKTAGPLGTIQITGGTLSPIVGFTSDKVTIEDLTVKTVVYEINPREIVVRLPSGVPAVKRDLKGSIHFHGNYEGKVISVDNGLKTVTVDFDNFVPENFHQNQRFSQQLQEFIIVSHSAGTTGVILQFNSFDDLSNIQTGKRFAALDIKREIPFVGSFIFDPDNTTFNITRLRTTLNQSITAGEILPQIVVSDASQIPDEPGVLIFNFGGENQEQPVKYLSRPNNSTLLIDPTHTFSKNHQSGELINVIIQEPPSPNKDGSDYAVYIVGVEEAREKIQDLVREIKAAGVVVRFLIEFPEYLFPKC